MKGSLLIMLLAFISNSIFANLTQGSWRWRADNGNETSATWLHDENTAISVSTNSVLRLRQQVFSSNMAQYSFCLQYSSSLNPGVWIDITNRAGSNAFELAGTSNHVLDNTTTTGQLTGITDAATFTFQPGAILLATEMIDARIGANTKSEYEWAIAPTNNIQGNVTYTFRVLNATSTALALPSLTTTTTLPVNLIDFSATAENKQVKIEWSTASELNNHHFDVERSADGTSWNVVNTVKGNGTTSSISIYSAYDNAPLNTVNYYRLLQVDLDGRKKVSKVVAVRFKKAELSMVIVYPNPTFSDIRFKVDNVNAKTIAATLVTLDGKTLYNESYSTSASTNDYKLNMKKKPLAGTYVLHVSGAGISLNQKVIVR